MYSEPTIPPTNSPTNSPSDSPTLSPTLSDRSQAKTHCFDRSSQSFDIASGCEKCCLRIVNLVFSFSGSVRIANSTSSHPYTEHPAWQLICSGTSPTPRHVTPTPIALIEPTGSPTYQLFELLFYCNDFEIYSRNNLGFWNLRYVGLRCEMAAGQAIGDLNSSVTALRITKKRVYSVT